jgi:hypothetical protein
MLVKNHIHIRRWFERRSSGNLEQRSFNYREFTPGMHARLQHRDLATNLNMGEWVPQWCFWFIKGVEPADSC